MPVKSLKRNKRTIYYATYVSMGTVEDEFEEYPIYSNPIKLECNINGGNGVWNLEGTLGTLPDYDRQIVMSGACPLKETDRVWVDVATTKEHNYVVERVIKGLNETVVGLRQVSASV